jgi:hypothetical protein
MPNLKKSVAERIVIDIVRFLHQKREIQVKLIIFEDYMEYEVQNIQHMIKIVPCNVHLSLSKEHIIRVSKLLCVLDLFQPDIIHSHLFEAEVVTRGYFYPQAKRFAHGHARIRSFEVFSFLKIRSNCELTNFSEKGYLLKHYLKNVGNHFVPISENIKEYFQVVLSKQISIFFYNTPNFSDN